MNDFVKLLNNDEKRNYSSNNFPSTSNASSTAHNSKRNPRVASNNHHKRYSLNENSIDADNINVSFAFPHDFDKYSENIWRKTVSSDCDQSIAVWEKQPETMTNWEGRGSGIYEPAPRNSSLFFDNDRDIFSTGENFFFPTSGGASTSWGASSSGRKLTTGESNSKSSSRRKQSNKVNSTSIDSDDDFQTIKKRLSLSSLRNSLCRQRALENLNNENQNQSSTNENINAIMPVSSSGSSDDFLQVFIISF